VYCPEQCSPSKDCERLFCCKVTAQLCDGTGSLASASWASAGTQPHYISHKMSAIVVLSCTGNMNVHEHHCSPRYQYVNPDILPHIEDPRLSIRISGHPVILGDAASHQQLSPHGITAKRCECRSEQRAIVELSDLEAVSRRGMVISSSFRDLI
jgi:hypothetical protein